MGINFCGGVSRGSGDIIKYVVVCSGILYVLLLHRTMYISNSQVRPNHTSQQQNLYLKTTYELQSIFLFWHDLLSMLPCLD